MANQSLELQDFSATSRAEPASPVLHVSLSMIFKWYGRDFAQSDAGLLRWLLPYVPEDAQDLCVQALNEGWRMEITYAPYNWDVNDDVEAGSSHTDCLAR